jgi:RNA polymerase sigma factor for flagellar operon FliA
LIETNEIERIPWAAIHPTSLDAIRELPSSSDPQKDLMDKCDCDIARKLVSSLSIRHQQVIHMYFVEELTLAAIGRLLNISEGRVSQLKIEALALLRAQTKSS